MQTLGQKISEEEVDEVFEIHNPEAHDPKIKNPKEKTEISYQEFKKIVMADVILPPQKISDMIKVDLRSRRSSMGWSQSLIGVNTSGTHSQLH